MADDIGGLHSLESYGTVVLVAGGIGITHPMSYMQEFVSGFAARSTAVRKVTLVWVVRSLGEYSTIRTKPNQCTDESRPSNVDPTMDDYTPQPPGYSSTQ